MEKDRFDMAACMRSVKFSVEELGNSPYQLLGEFIMRAEKDVFFNKTMIDAVKEYIRNMEE